jgi:hypothetical protein
MDSFGRRTAQFHPRRAYRFASCRMFTRLSNVSRMDLPQRAHLPHEVPSWVAEGSFFFITINCEGRGTNSLCRAGIGDAVLGAAAHNHEKWAWHCRLMLLMPDHLHAIIAFPREPTMKTIIANWKHFLAKRFLRSPFARSSPRNGEDELHPDEPGSPWPLRTRRRLAVDLSSPGPPAAKVGGSLRDRRR